MTNEFDTWLGTQPTGPILEAVEEQEQHGFCGTYDQLVAELDRRGVER